MKKFIAFMLAALPLAWGVSEAQVPVQKKAEEQRTLRKAPVVEGRAWSVGLRVVARRQCPRST